MYTLIIGIIIFCAVLLVISVLAQNSKGGGLSSQFGGSGASNMFGVKKTGDFLEKSTWTLVIIIMVLSLATNLDFVSKGNGPTNDVLEKAGDSQMPELPIPSGTEENAAPVTTDTAK